ncbi:MAG: hypothetical protein H6527_07195 [Actinobacteria bacterium]|nr:hypothetical protein [Actinomycetota bacterium]
MSVATLRAISEVCRRYRKTLFLDACRFAERVVHQDPRGYADVAIPDIVREISLAGRGMTMSAGSAGASADWH